MKKILFLIPLLTIGFCYASIDNNLKYGQSGQQVMELQDFLVSKGFLNVTPTGFFGMLTLNAVKAFQLSEGLPNTGYVGVLTRGKINESINLAVEPTIQAEIQEAPVVNQVAPQIAPQIQQPINTGNAPQDTFLPLPQPTCTLVMQKVTNNGYDLSSTTWTSTNADWIDATIVTHDGKSTWKTNKNVEYGTALKDYPATLTLHFTGKGGSVDCTASTE